MDNALCCTKCGEVVIKSVGSSTKIRAKVLVFNNDQTLAICKGCDAEIPIPVSVDLTMMKSVMENAKLRLYVRK